jgi:hypothetical protein
MSGLYIAWIETRDLAAINSDYGLTLAIKIVLALAAGILGYRIIRGGRGL